MARDPRVKLFQQKFWHGGFGDSPYLGTDASFFRADGVEIRRFPRMLKLNKLPEDKAGAVIDTAIYAAVTNTNGDTIAVGASGKIYRRASGGTTWAHVYTDSGADHIYDVCIYNDYVYWTTKNKLHRISEGDTGTDVTWTTVTEDYQSLTYDSQNHHPMVEAFNNLYVGDGDQLAELDSLGVWTADKLSFFPDDEVRRITFHGGVIRIYARKQDTDRDEGNVYIWNGTSDAYNEHVRLDGIFHTVCTRQGRDYFLAGHKPALYRLDGLSPVKLKVIPDLTSSTATDLDVRRCIIDANTMVVMDDVIYMGLLQTAVSGVSYIEKGIWSWGRLDEKYPECLTLEHSNDGIAIRCVFPSEGKLWFFVADGAAEEMYCVNPAKYSTTGEIETLWFDAGVGWKVKDGINIGLAFKPLAAGEQIDVYLRTDHGSYGSAVLTASNAVDGGTVTYKELLVPWTGKEFNQLQLKVKLTAGTNNGSTPTLLDLGVFFEDIKVNNP